MARGPSPYHTIHAGPEYGEALDIYTAGVDAGWLSKREGGRGFLRGRGEMVVDLLPVWLARLPEQTVTVHQPDGYILTTTLPSYNWHGLSAAPLLRWDLRRSYRHISQYGELGGGLLWTSRKFPQGKGTATTSRINFTPQVGFGANVFTRPHQSILAGISVVHTSSAGLGDYNPGVNVNLQFRLGYSWWR